MNIEEWRIIQEVPTYEVSNLGRVRNKGTGRILTFILNNGYRSVLMSRHGKHCRRLIHRLVALAFVDNSSGKQFVDHIDRDRLNNNIDNLRWVTREENAPRGSRRKSVIWARKKLDQVIVEQIRFLKANGRSSRSISRELGVSQTTVRNYTKVRSFNSSYGVMK